MSDRKKIILIAGPNGAGKTTFARSFLPTEAGVLRFINADLIAAGLSPFAPEAASIKAGKLMLREVRQAVEQGANFALETTLSGTNYLRHITEWQTLGYRVSLFFLRACSKSFKQQNQKGQMDELQASIEQPLAVFP